MRKHKLKKAQHSWIPSFFKRSFFVKAKISSIERAHFKVVTPKDTEASVPK